MKIENESSKKRVEIKADNKNIDDELMQAESTEMDEEPKDKFWLGVICGVFVPFFISVLIGYSLFDAGSMERKTFFQAYWKVFGIVYTIGLIVGGIWGIVILSSIGK